MPKIKLLACYSAPPLKLKYLPTMPASFLMQIHQKNFNAPVKYYVRIIGTSLLEYPDFLKTPNHAI